jgi:hypothetical protein
LSTSPERLLRGSLGFQLGLRVSVMRSDNDVLARIACAVSRATRYCNKLVGR